MSGLFGGGGGAPKPQPAAPMPDPDSPTVLNAGKKRMRDILSRSGRRSTILSDGEYSNDKLG